MQILPVIDLRDGTVVLAVAGQRSLYRPLTSRLTPSAEPITVAKAIRDHFGWTEFYLADLNAISGTEPSFTVYHGLQAEGLRLWVDAGVRDGADAERLAATAVERVVVGLETLNSRAAWRTIIQRIGAERAVFSLDLYQGRPLASVAGWGDAAAHTIVERVVADGGRQVIVLDLAQVGTGGGTGTEALCGELVRRHPGVAFWAGGGVRGMDDVRRFEQIGIAGLLLASILHDGKFKPVS
jgi:phosphoribosylformimino-5-aminoimidazole carboxamide ribotide isomerase